MNKRIYPITLTIILMSLLVLAGYFMNNASIHKSKIEAQQAYQLLDEIRTIQIAFAKLDGKLAQYDAQQNFSQNAYLDVTDGYDIIVDYVELLNLTDEESLTMMAELQLYMAQWVLVRDKIFAGTADYHGMMPLAHHTHQLLAKLAMRERTLLKNRLGVINPSDEILRH